MAWRDVAWCGVVLLLNGYMFSLDKATNKPAYLLLPFPGGAE